VTFSDLDHVNSVLKQTCSNVPNHHGTTEEKNLLDLHYMGTIKDSDQKEKEADSEVSVLHKYIGIITICYFFSLFLIVNFLFHISYEENDDVVMGLIASGAYGNSPDYHLVFIHSLLGLILSSFYHITTNTEFYTILMISLNVFSFAALSNVFLSLFLHKRLKIIMFLFFSTIFIYQLSVLQFTRTASFLAISGIASVLFGKNKYTGGLLILIGFLLRFHAAMLICLLSLPLSFYHLMMLRTAERLKKRIVFISLLVFVIILRLIDYMSYQSSKEWSYYHEYNLVRGKLNDNPNFVKAGVNLPKDFPENEYNLLESFLPNPVLVSYDKLKVLAEDVTQTPFLHKIQNIIMILMYWFYFLVLGLCLLCLCLFFPKQRILITSLFLLNFFLLCYVSMDGTLKSRVFFSSFFATLIFSLASVEGYKHKQNNLLFCIAGILVVVFLNLSIIGFNLNKINRKEFLKQNEMIKNYLSQSPGIIPFGASYNIEYCDPFSFSSDFPTNKIFFGGWLTNIPFNTGRFDSFNYFVNNYAVLVNDEYVEKASGLISKSIMAETNVTVKPVVVLNKYGLSIIEFHTEAK
jgi:hypothetical protein